MNLNENMIKNILNIYLIIFYDKFDKIKFLFYYKIKKIKKNQSITNLKEDIDQNMYS